MLKNILLAAALLAAALSAEAQIGPPPIAQRSASEKDCLVPFSATVPSDEEPVADEMLEPIPVWLHDDALALCPDLSPLDRRPMLAYQAASASPAGWTVVAGTVREFHSTDNLYLFSVAAVKDKSGRQGVLLSRGVYITVQGKKVLNWERRVLTNAELVEYATPPAMAPRSFIGDIFGDIWDFFVNKIIPLITDEFGKLITDAIKEVFKQAEKWLQNIIADLFGQGKSSQLPKLYLAHMQMNKAIMPSVERYFTTIVASRTSPFTIADRVFLSLQNPVEQMHDANAGHALAKTIEAIR